MHIKIFLKKFVSISVAAFLTAALVGCFDLGDFEDEADFVVKCDFENPYDTPFILQDYEGDYIVDGKEYEVRSCHTDFCYCGLFHLADKEPFEFYMFFDRETMSDNTVGSYQNATKLYLI